jgi:Flp pilus assembly protein TadD
MSHASRRRRTTLLTLLATAAAACLLSACSTTDTLFSSKSLPPEDVQMSAPEAVAATQQWAAAYAKNPQDPRIALSYARTLKRLGSNDRALEVLKTAFQANVTNGDIAAETGRLALELNYLEIAKPALEVAEQQGVHDWKTLSAQGTLRAKEGQYGQAQRYYLAALDLQPDALSVINNLALSYTLDGEADKAEELLRKAVSSGHDDNRIRQNLALVLGLQGKFSEARQYASADMSEASVKANMAYLRNMVSSSAQLAAAKPETPNHEPSSADDWQPFASNATGNEAPVQIAAAKPEATAKVQMVNPVNAVEKSASKRVASGKASGMSGISPRDAVSLLRTDIE